MGARIDLRNDVCCSKDKEALGDLIDLLTKELYLSEVVWIAALMLKRKDLAKSRLF